MDMMSRLISSNLKKIRKDKKLSLDQVSEATGVSKSMLGQIERGESSPTVATLWKIATGLHISFTALLEEEKRDAQIVYQKDVTPLLSDEGRFSLQPFFPYNENRRFEVLAITMEKGACSDSAPHEEGTEEYLLVTEGRLNLKIENQEFIIDEGNGIRFDANRAHVYANASDAITKIYMVIYYKQ